MALSNILCDAWIYSKGEIYYVHHVTIKTGVIVFRAGLNSKWIGINQINSNSISELEQKLIWIKRFGTKWIELELELKGFELDWNWNWIYRNLASDMFVMLQSMLYRQLWVLLCRQWCLMTKKSWTMKLLVKHYPAINKCMKLINGKSIRLILLTYVNECWLGTAWKNHWNYPDTNHSFLVSHAKQILPRYHKWSQDISKHSKV